MKKFLLTAFTVLLFSAFLGGCGSQSGMQDGFYTAEMAEYSHGWKEYLCIMVKNDHIVYAEFNAKDPSGYIKAWDNTYMQNMKSVEGTYPNEYTRKYVAQLIEKQSTEGIEAISGATHSGGNFEKLSAAVIEQAKKGDSNIYIVTTEEE